MTTNISINKQLAVMEDLLPGIGEVTQQRGSIAISNLGKVDVYYAVLTLEKLNSLEELGYHYAKYENKLLRYDANAIAGEYPGLITGYWVMEEPTENVKRFVPVPKQYPLLPFAGTTITLEDTVDFVQVMVDGLTLPPRAYTFTPPSNTIELVDPVTINNEVVVSTAIGGGPGTIKSSEGFISDYLSTTATVRDAIELASQNHEIVNFEGLTLTAETSPQIAANAKCLFWNMAGGTLIVRSGEVDFYNRMNGIYGAGEVNLGNKLGKIAQNGTKDANTIVVYQTTPEVGPHGFEIGEYISCSLDNDYLPNSPNRVGYQEYGDFNRIIDIIDNGDGTDTLVMSYPFLRSSDPLVSTGLIQNAWVGQSNFQVRGLQFHGNPDGHLYIRDTAITHPIGYTLNLDNGPGDLRKATIELDCPITETFIDMLRLRCRGVIFGSNYIATRQYDFSKQHLVLDMPTDGFVVYRSGCRVERQNRDGEVFYTPFESGQTLVERGAVYVEPGVVFDGSQPTDLPTSDFGPGGQVYWGKLVAISDALHFEVPNAPDCHAGGLYFSGEARGYIRCIAGTSFASKASYETGPIVFTGAKLSCEPAYIAVTGGTTPSERYEKYRVVTINCEIRSRGLNNYDGGCYHEDYGSNIVMTREAQDTPQLNGSQTFNFVKKQGGRLDGRYTINGSDTSLKEVIIPYKGTDKPDEVVLFRSPTLPNPNEMHLILDVPDTDDFEGSGKSFLEYDQVLPIVAWFGSNFTNQQVAPPFVNFKFLNVQQTFQYGSPEGFSKWYRQEISMPRTDLGPIPTHGVWSGLLSKGDVLESRVDGAGYVAVTNQQTTLNATVSVGDPSIVVNDALDFDVNLVGIYTPQFGTWFWYRTDAKAGDTTVDLGNTYNSLGGVFPAVGHAAGSLVSLVKMRKASEVVCKVRTVDPNTQTIGNATEEIIFGTILRDDTDSECWTPGQPTRIYPPAGAKAVDIAASIDFGSNDTDVGSGWTLRILQWDSEADYIAENRKDIAGTSEGTIWYSSLKATTGGGLSVDVDEGDFFTVEFRNNTAVPKAYTKATVTIRGIF